MNIALIEGPANITGEDLRQLLLSAFGGGYDADADTWHDSKDVSIPYAGQAPGTKGNAGKQLAQLVCTWTLAELDQMLANYNPPLAQYKIEAHQSFDVFQVPDTDPIEYAPEVTKPIPARLLGNLIPRDGETENYNWFPGYAGQADWVGE